MREVAKANDKLEDEDLLEDSDDWELIPEDPEDYGNTGRKGDTLMEDAFNNLWRY